MIDCVTEQSGGSLHKITVRTHTLHADLPETDEAPTPHDYFDSALASCIALTVLVYARFKKIALEKVETHVERDDHEERSGKYGLKVRVGFHGTLSDDERKRLFAVAEKCPIHKLMTTSEVTIETAPIEVL